MSNYQKIVVEDEKRVFFVGDIHGAFDLYLKACKDLGITNEDVVVSVGDLIDRGDKNLQTVLEFTRKENRYAVQGNHEDLMIKGLLKGSLQHEECWLVNGGIQTFQEVGEEGIFLLAEMVKDLPVTLEVEHQGKTFGVVHGGIPCFRRQEKDWSEVVLKAHQQPGYCEELIWDRSVIDHIKHHIQMETNPEDFVPAVDGIDFVLHGHTPVKDPIVVANRIYIDTGGVFNNRLTFAWYENDQMNFYTTGDYDDI